jgi:hypothetical protein
VGPRAGLDIEARGKILCPCLDRTINDFVLVYSALLIVGVIFN